VDFGLDLDARIALVGPNGAGKSTLVKVREKSLLVKADRRSPDSPRACFWWRALERAVFIFFFEEKKTKLGEVLL
jgi:ABC-type hemin transport system ATPase subunit